MKRILSLLIIFTTFYSTVFAGGGGPIPEDTPPTNDTTYKTEVLPPPNSGYPPPAPQTVPLSGKGTASPSAITIFHCRFPLLRQTMSIVVPALTGKDFVIAPINISPALCQDYWVGGTTTITMVRAPQFGGVVSPLGELGQFHVDMSASTKTKDFAIFYARTAGRIRIITVYFLKVG
jgi:hypothetical protein